jgi:hypothetical protein
MFFIKNAKGLASMYEGEWISVLVGNVIAIGYIKTIGFYGGQIEIMRVSRITGGEVKWASPTRALFEADRLKPLGTLLDDWQDKSVLIDLALLMKDKQWFEELTREMVPLDA